MSEHKTVVTLVGGPCDGEEIDMLDGAECVFPSGHHLPYKWGEKIKPVYRRLGNDRTKAYYDGTIDVSHWSEA